MSDRYCLDTSALIEAWVRSYPRDLFPSLWTRFDEMIADGGLLCPDEVLYELEKKEDDLHEWAKERSGLFYPLDVDLQLAVQDVLRTFPRLVDTRKFRSRADPFVVALARITGRVVVSGEKHSGNPNSPRIPDV